MATGVGVGAESVGAEGAVRRGGVRETVRILIQR